MTIGLRKIEGKPEEMRELQRVFDEAPIYAMNVMGHPPGPEEARSTYTILPPGYDSHSKYVYGIYLNNHSLNHSPEKMIGCIDLIRGYPDEKTAMLGLLLLSEKVHGMGYGTEAFKKIETLLSEWPEVETLRIAILASNGWVTPFWEKMGFQDTGIRKPYHSAKLDSEHAVFEKKIARHRFH